MSEQKPIESYKYEPKDDQTLKKLARDVVEGRICILNLLTDKNVLEYFPILAFLAKSFLESLVENKIAVIYEYYENALKSGHYVSGHDSFYQCRFLNNIDAKKLQEFIYEYRLAIGDFMEDKR